MDDDPMLIDCMVEWFYNLDYSDGHSEEDEPLQDEDENEINPSSMPLAMNVSMYIMADKYDIPGLRDSAVSKFLERVSSGFWWARDFASAIKLIWTSVPSSEMRLREACLDRFRESRKQILSRSDEVIADIRSTSEFLFDALRADQEGL